MYSRGRKILIGLLLGLALLAPAALPQANAFVAKDNDEIAGISVRFGYPRSYYRNRNFYYPRPYYDRFFYPRPYNRYYYNNPYNYYYYYW